MGTTAEKLTYLNTTKGKIKDSINLTGAGITNQDTFRSYASKLKLGLIDIINNGIDQLYSNFPKVSGIGSNLSLTPTYEAPMRSEIYYGDTLQDGTPTPSSPIDIQTATGLQNVNVCGKNLFDISTLQDGYVTSEGTINTNHPLGEMHSNFIKVQPSTSYTFKINETSSTYDNWIGIGEYTNNNYTDFVIRKTMTTATQNYYTFTTNSNTKYIIVSARNLHDATKIQLEKGSTATEYEPYKGNTYEVNLGKNYINNITLNNTNNGVTPNYNSSTNVIGFTGKATSSYVTIGNINNLNIESGEYNLKINSIKSYRIILRVYTDSTNYSEVSLNANTLNTKLTISNTIVSIRILINTSSGTTYNETFKLSFVSANDLELCKINTYQDSIKKSDGKNLFDKTTITDGKWLLANGDEEVATQYCISDFIPVIENEQYYLPKTDTRRLKYYDSNKQPLTTSDWDISSGTEGQIINVPSNAKYVRFTIHKTVVDINTFMFNKGSTALPYEPYGKVWYILKKIGKKIYTTSEIENAPRTYNNVKFFTIPKPTNSYMYNNYNRGNLLYTHAEEQITGDLDSVNRINKISNIWPETLWVGFNTSTTLETAQQYLNNSILYYPLTTPTYTEITNEELIEDLETLYTAKSQEGTTNISITSEDLPMLLSASALEMTD